MVTAFFVLQLRAEHVVPRRMAEMEDAISKKDFDKFADLTMKVSQRQFLLYALTNCVLPPW